MAATVPQYTPEQLYTALVATFKNASAIAVLPAIVSVQKRKSWADIDDKVQALFGDFARRLTE